MQTIIGIIPSIDEKKNSTILHHYVRSIEIAGGTPLVLPYCENTETLEHFGKICEGFLFAGGSDIAPDRYGEETKQTCGKIIYERDTHDFRMFEIALQTEKPILGICRGAQLINVALGGTLYQDIPTEIVTYIAHRQTEADDVCTHEVNVEIDSPLYKILGKSRIAVNSFHHQCAKQ